jgi:hypothetical protein
MSEPETARQKSTAASSPAREGRSASLAAKAKASARGEVRFHGLPDLTRSSRLPDSDWADSSDFGWVCDPGTRLRLSLPLSVVAPRAARDRRKDDGRECRVMTMATCRGRLRLHHVSANPTCNAGTTLPLRLSALRHIANSEQAFGRRSGASGVVPTPRPRRPRRLPTSQSRSPVAPLAWSASASPFASAAKTTSASHRIACRLAVVQRLEFVTCLFLGGRDSRCASCPERCPPRPSASGRFTTSPPAGALPAARGLATDRAKLHGRPRSAPIRYPTAPRRWRKSGRWLALPRCPRVVSEA